MNSITHLINSIESFSKHNFKFSQYFQPLIILNKIPDSISVHLNDIDFIYHLDEASQHIDWINRFFEDHINSVTKKEISYLKSSKNRDVQIPYADFTVNGPPIFKKEAPSQISFDDILRYSMLNGFPLTPVKPHFLYAYRLQIKLFQFLHCFMNQI